MKKVVFISLGFLFIILCALIFRPVPIVEERKAIAIEGIVVDVIDGGNSDVFIRLKDDNRRYYVNRGLDAGLNVNDLKNKLVKNKVVLKYPKYWTPLDWNNKIRHISKVEFGNEVLYNELK